MSNSLEILDRVNRILKETSRDEVREWSSLRCTQIVSLVLQSNIEALKETWEISGDSAFDNAVQNAKGRGKCAAFRECLSIIDDVMTHLEEDEKNVETTGTQSPT